MNWFAVTKGGWAGYLSVKVGDYLCVSPKYVKELLNHGVCFHSNRCIYFAVLKCDPPSQIKDGSFDPEKDEYDHGDVVRYNCQKDLTLNGSKLTTCSDDGSFKPNPPECVSKSIWVFFLHNSYEFYS